MGGRGARYVIEVIAHDRRQDTGSAICGRGDNLPPGRVFLIYGQRIKINPIDRALVGDGFDTANAACNRAFGGDFKEANIASTADMGAAA